LRVCRHRRFVIGMGGDGEQIEKHEASGSSDCG
jgi:hypothetical protein